MTKNIKEKIKTWNTVVPIWIKSTGLQPINRKD